MLGVGFNTYTLTVANDDLLIRETQAAIQADIGGFRSLYEESGRAAVYEAIKNRLANINNDFLYHFKDENGNHLTGNLKNWPTDQNVSLIKNGVLEIEINTQDLIEEPQGKIRQETAIAMVIEFSNGEALMVARNVQDIEFAVALARISSYVMIIIVLIVAITSLGVAYYVVSRINKIADTADDIIATGNLSDRLYVESQWDDLSKLNLVLNQLLDKIESSVKAISSVSDSIAHDLRTPLTRLKTHLEDIKDPQERLQLINECDNLLSIFNSLLRISDIENSAKRAGFTTLDLDEVANDAIELYSPLLEDKQITISADVTPISKFVGDRDLLFQCFANLLDNAIKFTPQNGTIEIQLTRQNKNILFSIDDTGTGVSEQSIEKLTRRFYREDKSRTASGNGLGLALVNAIVQLHEGRIWFEKSHIKNSSGLRCNFLIQSA